MVKVTLHPVQRQMRLLHKQAEMQQQQVDTLQMVVAWLLAQQPGDDALRFLCRQANDLDEAPRYREDVQTLDDLREVFSAFRAAREAGPEMPG
jgi:hypothetical protein